MSLYLGENLISGQATLVGESRNIGQIIPSTIPLTDAGLHLLDGALIQGDGIYSTFVTYIAGLVSTYPNLFVTESDWQTSVTTYGVCGKFVYDSVNNTVRLPKVTGIIEGTTDVTALGDLIEAGLPDHLHTLISTQNYNGNSDHGYSDGYVAGITNSGLVSGNTSTTKASESNSIYGNSSTVQPQTIKAYYYIVIATSTKTDIQVDIDDIATDLNGKVNISDLQEVQCVVETYQNGTSWYRVYSDGWCEQGGRATISSYYANITFLKQFLDTNYNIGFAQNSVSEDTYCACVESFTNSTMRLRFRGGGTFCFWQASGYVEV